MNRLISLIFASALLSQCAMGQSPVNLAIDAKTPGKPIPPGFIGFSFETGSLRYNHYRTNDYFFDSSNAQLLTLFRNLGIKTLRIGGNSVDRGFIPTHQDIDALFRFAKAADVKVIYSLRLANGDALQDAAMAKYVWDNYRTYLICLAIGNEPNSYKNLDPEITDSASFIAKWNKFAAKVIDAVPDVKLGGLDNGNGATTWVSAFAQAEKGNSHVGYILSHFEPGGSSVGKTEQQLIDEMLSPVFDTKRNPTCDAKIAAIAHSSGFSYLFSEANSHVATPASKGSNHSFATALFALDFMHWWAAHNCLAVDFHTGLAGFNAALSLDAKLNYELYPIGYGIAAFNVGGHGLADAMTIKNPDNLNLAAYAVTDTNNDLYVTIINREHGKGRRDGMVTINARGKSKAVMYLKVPDDDVAGRSGVTLGGATIDGRGNCQATWTSLDSPNATGTLLKVKASTAAVVKITEARIEAP